MIYNILQYIIYNDIYIYIECVYTYIVNWIYTQLVIAGLEKPNCKPSPGDFWPRLHDQNGSGVWMRPPCFSPPARWGLLDFMSVACSSSPLLSSSSPLLLLVVLLVLLVQLRPAIHSVLCRTSTTTIHAQCSLPDLNREYPCQVFPAGPQPRVSPPSVPCRTSTASIPAQCSLPDLNHDHPRPVFPAGPQPRVSTPKDMPHRVPEDMPDRMLEDMPDRMPEGMPDRMPDRMSARMPEDMPDKVPECLPDRMPADLPW